MVIRWLVSVLVSALLFGPAWAKPVASPYYIDRAFYEDHIHHDKLDVRELFRSLDKSEPNSEWMLTPLVGYFALLQVTGQEIPSDVLAVSLPALSKLLHNPQTERSSLFSTLQIVEGHGALAAPLEPLVLELAQTPSRDMNIRKQALLTLKAMGSESSLEVLEKLVASEPEPALRFQAMDTYLELSHTQPSKRWLDELRQVAESEKESPERLLALQVLAQFCTTEEAPALLTRLKTLIASPSSRIERWQLLSVVYRLPKSDLEGEISDFYLQTALNDSDSDVRSLAAHLLYRLLTSTGSSVSPESLETLRSLFRNNPSRFSSQLELCELLGEVPPQYVESISRGLNDELQAPRLLRALTRMGPKAFRMTEALESFDFTKSNIPRFMIEETLAAIRLR